MLIKEIKPAAAGKNKYKVCLEGGADFVLYRKELAEFDLRKNTELSEETYEKLLEKVFIPRAKKRAMHLLEKMDRTEENLKGKLQENGYPPEAIEAAIEYVKSYHYVDDDRYAYSYVRQYQGRRSKARIYQDLLQKGIDKETIDRAIEEEFESSEGEMIRELMRKKGYDPSAPDPERKNREKLIRFLLGRGFGMSDILRELSDIDTTFGKV